MPPHLVRRQHPHITCCSLKEVAMPVKQGRTATVYAETLSHPSCTHYLSKSNIRQSRTDMCPVQALLLRVVASVFTRAQWHVLSTSRLSISNSYNSRAHHPEGIPRAHPAGCQRRPPRRLGSCSACQRGSSQSAALPPCPKRHRHFPEACSWRPPTAWPHKRRRRRWAARRMPQSTRQG